MSTILTLKQRIRQGDVVVALRVPVTIGRTQVEDALAKGSYDFLYIDGQHTAFSEDQLVSFCALAEELNLPVQFRIPHTRHTYLIGRYLDLGPTSIMVPETETVATVEEAIAYAYYPPVGQRSWGGIARRKAPTGQTGRRAYADWWNNYVVLTLQLESVAAITNARRLARPGVDALAFGPNDLEFSLELHPEYPLRTVDECMRNVAAQLHGTGVRLSMAVPTVAAEREKYLAMGVTIFQELPKS
jgi:2-keto-3-deoxy-L-rhamnonate aldolase RhmA